MDLADAAARKIAVKEWRSREFDLAKAMRVAMVFTYTSLATTPAYSLFLSRMAEGAKAHGPIGAGKFTELPIRVAGMFMLVTYLLNVKFSFLKPHSTQHGNLRPKYERILLLACFHSSKLGPVA